MKGRDGVGHDDRIRRNRVRRRCPDRLRLGLEMSASAQSRALDVFSEADSNEVGQTRGRRVVFSDEALRGASGFSYARHVGSRRGAQDLVYRMFAVAVIEHYCEAFSENARSLQWLLRPRRHTLLSELGRIAQPRSGHNGELLWHEKDVALMVETALEIAEAQPSTRDGIAIIRQRRKDSRQHSSRRREDVRLRLVD